MTKSQFQTLYQFTAQDMSDIQFCLDWGNSPGDTFPSQIIRISNPHPPKDQPCPSSQPS